MTERKKTPRFEYRYEDIHGTNWIDKMNALGAEGWSVISFEKHSEANAWVIFGRDLPEESDEEDRDREDGRRRPPHND